MTSGQNIGFEPTGHIGRVNFGYTIATSVTSTTWSPATGLNTTSNLSTTANPSTTTQYTLTAVDANGCQAQDVVDVTVNALPTINATPASRCDDGTVDLGAAPSSGTTLVMSHTSPSRRQVLVWQPLRVSYYFPSSSPSSWSGPTTSSAADLGFTRPSRISRTIRHWNGRRRHVHACSEQAQCQASYSCKRCRVTPLMITNPTTTAKRPC